MKTLQDIAHKLYHQLMNSRGENRLKPRRVGLKVSWIVRRNNWFTPICIGLYHKNGPNFVRFASNRDVNSLPHTYWPFELPKSHGFELTALTEEVDQQMIESIISHAEKCAESKYPSCVMPPSQFNAPRGCGAYAWTKVAWSKAQENQNLQ